MARQVASHVLTSTVLVLVCFVRRDLASEIKGLQISCSNEGEEVSQPPITDDPCIACRCLGKWVKCVQEACPMADTCHLVLKGHRLRPDSCCEKCKGCQTPEGSFLDGERWLDPNDVCQVNQCFSGVVTNSKIKCHTPCPNPLPPAPGQCCPRCPGCLLSGHVIEPGQNLTSPSDPCTTCSCGLDGTQSCSRLVCPALSCPVSETRRERGQCCPQCSGKRRVAPDTPGCQMGKKRYSPGQNFTLDPCTTCSCQGSTSICHRQSCPELACPPLLQVHSPDRCCAVCRKPERVRRVCIYMRRQYQEGETWKRDPCTTCSCNNGQLHCVAERCAAKKLVCPPGHHAAKVPGQCCQQCVEDDAVCTVFGDPHYNTFDGKMFNYQGTCKYQLAKDCSDRTFSIRVNNSPRRSRFFSWTQSATIKAGDLRIALRQNKRVKVNRKSVDLPYVNLGQVTILQDPSDNFNVLVKLSALGVSVLWDGDSFLQVKVPPSYKDKMCGLCGNYNGNKTDDFTTKRGRLVKLTKRFARSWMVGGRTLCTAKSRRQARRHRKRRPAPCGGDRDAHANAINQCNLLKSKRFRECHAKIHPAAFFKSCVQDMCECGKRRTCYCEALTAYSHACQRRGVTVDWLKGTDCAAPLQCPRKKRLVKCSTGCQPSCAVPEPTAEQCATAAAAAGPCRAGCVCRKGLLLHEGACVPADRCPAR